MSASQSAPPPVALSTGLDPLIAARLKRDAAGLVPAIVQQYDSGAVLMLAWMNDAALARTLASGQTATVKMGDQAFAIGAQSFVVQNGAAVINATQAELKAMIASAAKPAG